MEIEIEVNDENFKEKVIDQSKKIPVIVDFWAQWCAPCFLLDPILEKLAKEYKGKFILAKFDVSKNPWTSQKFGINAIPTVKLFKNGKVIDKFIGVLPEYAVKQWLEKNI